jgi:hypothetical protein
MQHTVTEEEARERWCPFARAYDLLNCDGDAEYRPVTVNRQRGRAPDEDCLCIASNCMAWRWEPNAEFSSYSRRGFCGLAGGTHA